MMNWKFWSVVSAAVLLSACSGSGTGNVPNYGEDPTPTPSMTPVSDVDGDSVPASQDCNDSDASVTVAVTWYVDSDSDGYGNADQSFTACLCPVGYVSNAEDCDDGNVSINPSASETCNGEDDDCDGVIDPVDSEGVGTWYVDQDDDGYGDSEQYLIACYPFSGYVSDSTDCDDGNISVHPGALEVCDGIDNDCNKVVDPSNSQDADTWYMDSDGDGFGDRFASVKSCTMPFGSVPDATDCDDRMSNINPSMPEICNGMDDNCDTVVDEDSADAEVWYLDADGDGYGDTEDLLNACTQPEDRVLDDTDCDDANAKSFPGASELCDGEDNDCDGSTDENLSSLWYVDNDRDGFGSGAGVNIICQGVSNGLVDNADDCDDIDGHVHPGASEVCNGVDDNCDGLIDQSDSADAAIWYHDMDGDGYGTVDHTVVTCSKPDGYVSVATDCDDSQASVNPSKVEVCDGIDNNCDGFVDVDSTDAKSWYMDSDDDGYGNKDHQMLACNAPEGCVEDATDCNDENGQIHPGASELCDGIDNNCDGLTDDVQQSQDVRTWFADQDGDGYGDSQDQLSACAQPDGYVADANDCNDQDSLSFPGASESCDGLDNNCNGVKDENLYSTWYVDADGDGFGSGDAVDVICLGVSDGLVDNANDCDDTDNQVHPGANEVCNGVDDDCDGSIDPDTSLDVSMWYHDQDGDGYGMAGHTTVSCFKPDGYVSVATDCDDMNASVHPDALEVCDQIDNDCDKDIDPNTSADAKTWYMDSDSDGYGDEDVMVSSCAQPDGYVSDANDCNDSNGQVYPGANELCDGIDNNCDMLMDTDESVDVLKWFVDVDEDGYGDKDVMATSCTQPEGYVATDTDCNDQDSLSFPGAPESCDGSDNDCDGSTDENLSSAWYVDADGDSFGSGAKIDVVCNGSKGNLVDNASDCNDQNPGVHPGASETCNGIDDDCSGEVDPDTSLDASVWYHDQDGDGYGAVGYTDVSCSKPDGYVSNATDCDDTYDGINPSATETCDGLDNNCDSVVDPDTSVGAPTLYADEDGDGYGNAESFRVTCQNLVGYVGNDTDCDDQNDDVHPEADEVCDGIDNNCDDRIDPDSSADAQMWYLDGDMDGYGNRAAAFVSCTKPDEYVADATDCDDTNKLIYPNGPEVCDGLDNDCDGVKDENLSTKWYLDRDGDGYGSGSAIDVVCQGSSGDLVDNKDDCNDASTSIHPGASEIFDDLDNDCDVGIDEDWQVVIDVSYDVAQSRTLRAQLFGTASQLDDQVWSLSINFVSTDIGLEFKTSAYGDLSAYCGVRLDVLLGDPMSSAMCADLDDDQVLIDLWFAGEVYTEADLLTWNDPETGFCSAVLVRDNAPQECSF